MAGLEVQRFQRRAGSWIVQRPLLVAGWPLVVLLEPISCCFQSCRTGRPWQQPRRPQQSQSGPLPRRFRAAAVGGQLSAVSAQSGGGSAALVAVVVSTAVANRVANRLLLVPLSGYTQFLAQVTSVVQLTSYTALRWWGVRQGRITKEMQGFVARNWALVAAVGACEGIFYPLVFASASRLPGGLVQVLNQLVVPFTVLFSALLLGRCFDLKQLTGVAVVLCGVLLAGLGTQGGQGNLCKVDSFDVLLCALAYGTLALGVTLKDMVFSRYQKQREDLRAPDASTDQRLNVALLSSTSAAAQLVVQLLITLAWGGFAWGLQGGGPALAAAVEGGSRALLGIGPGAEPVAPWLALTYWVSNVAFSLSVLELVRQASSTAVVLANVVALPLSALVFCCPLPMLPQQAFRWQFAVSLVLVVVGNLLYSYKAL